MPLTPLSLQNYDFNDPAQARQYQYQMMQFLNGLLSQFTTLQNQVTTALTPGTKNLGALTGNTTFDAAGAMHVSITFTFAVALTLTITDLPIGAVFQMNFTNTAAGGRILTGVASQPGGTAYSSWLANLTTGQQNLLTGWSVPAGNNYFCLGMAENDPAINMLANLN